MMSKLKILDIIQPVPDDSMYNLSETAYLEECRIKAQYACESFEYATNGFTAKLILKMRISYFSVFLMLRAGLLL